MYSFREQVSMIKRSETIDKTDGKNKLKKDFIDHARKHNKQKLSPANCTMQCSVATARRERKRKHGKRRK